jgi:hypothetical protein
MYLIRGVFNRLILDTKKYNFEAISHIGTRERKFQLKIVLNTMFQGVFF